jgi:hypothetical protein
MGFSPLVRAEERTHLVTIPPAPHLKTSPASPVETATGNESVMDPFDGAIHS